MNATHTTESPSSSKPHNGTLMHALEEWRITLDSMRDAVCLVDRDGCIQRCNRAMQEFLGIPFDQINGRNCWELVYGQLIPPVGGEFRSSLQFLRQSETHTSRIGERWYEITLTPIFNSGGRLAGAAHVMADITALRQAEEDLRYYSRQQAQLLHQVSVRMTNADEALRKRLARELHDRVGQTITALGINLNVVQESLPHEKPELHERLNECIGEIEDISDIIRNVMAELRPAVLDDYGLAAALRWYGEKFAHRTGIDVDLVDTFAPLRMPTDVETALFRIAQEALTNISKHAHANTVTLALTGDASAVSLVIEDDGHGFDAHHGDVFQQRGRWGLLTMQERAEGVGGQCTFTCTPGHGVTVTVVVERSTDVQADHKEGDDGDPRR